MHLPQRREHRRRLPQPTSLAAAPACGNSGRHGEHPGWPEVTLATLVLSFIAGFGISKALANLLSGRLADRLGRRRLLVTARTDDAPSLPALVTMCGRG